MSSLDRLIDLAKRTGDRLIVHDPIEGRDVVIMDVDEYERIALPKKDVRELSSRQMLDQINRDIAIWRANKETEERWDREEQLEDELMEEELEDKLDFLDDDWHSAGSVIDRQYKDQNIRKSEDHDFADLDIDEDMDWSPSTRSVELAQDEEEVKVEDIPFDIPQDKTGTVDGEDDEPEDVKVKSIPQSEHSGEYFEDGGDLKEEKLSNDDEPVFYEEPI